MTRATVKGRERAAVRRAILAGLDAFGDELEEATLLIGCALAGKPDADEEAVMATAESL